MERPRSFLDATDDAWVAGRIKVHRRHQARDLDQGHHELLRSAKLSKNRCDEYFMKSPPAYQPVSSPSPSSCTSRPDVAWNDAGRRQYSMASRELPTVSST